MHLAQAHSNRAPRGRKGDFRDAERLLRRHVAGELILSFVPNPEQRLWRTVKYEEVYLKGYETVPVATRGLGEYFRFYNEERLHQALAYRTPAAVYHAGAATRARLG